VLLVTKAVGDLLGVRGIAEEAIRFNGYPFLEKNDHVYDAPGQYILMLEAETQIAEYYSITGHAERHLYPAGHGYDPRGCR
jgi:chloride channel 3/4/5